MRVDKAYRDNIVYDFQIAANVIGLDKMNKPED